jgi:hypothetical protein
MERAAVVVEPHQREAHLYALGLAEGVLRDAVAKGLDARKRCTAFDPPSFPGIAQWAMTHRSLREVLTLQGWSADDTGGFSTVVSPNGRVAVTVAAGDDRTGKHGLPTPTTKHRRGPLTHAAIEGNQLALFGPGAQLDDEHGADARRVTWILLVATRHDEVRVELSCPRAIDEAGRVASWSERIILDALEVEPTLDLLPDEDDPDLDIDVPIERL